MDNLLNFNSKTPIIFGRNTVSGVAMEELYEYSQAIDWLATMPTPTALDYSSTTTTDIDTTGTGARKIQVVGCNALGEVISETISLNGQTKVTGTVLFKLVYSAEVVNAGSLGTNTGIIHILKTGTGGTYTAGVPTILTSGLVQIPVGFGESYTGIYCVPPKKIASIKFLRAVTRTQACTLFIKSQKLDGTGILNQIGMPIELAINSAPTKLFANEIGQPLIEFKAGTVIRMRVLGASASAVVTASMFLTLNDVK